MTLRLVLVSLVAALGLTIPGTSMIEGWVASSQNWMNARFADWDTRNPPAADYVIVSDYYDPAHLSSRSHTTIVPEVKLVPETVVTQKPLPSASPVTVSPEEQIAVRVSHSIPVRRVALTTNRVDFRPIDITSGWHRGIALELNRRHEGIRLAVSREVSPARVRPWFTPLAIAEPLRTLVDELNRQNEGIGLVPPRPSATKLAGGPRCEPIPVPDQLEVGIAYELNRRSEGIGFAPISIPESSTAESPVSRIDPQSSAPSFSMLERDPNLYFAGELLETSEPREARSSIATQPAPSSEKSADLVVTASRVSIPPSSAPAVFASVKVEEKSERLDDLDIEVAGELAPAQDGFGIPAQRVRSITPRIQMAGAKQPFEPLIAEGVSTLVDELNRQHDGLDLIATAHETPSPTVASSSRPGRSLSRAVELTRDAVYAWVNVLSGPALVTVSSSR